MPLHFDIFVNGREENFSSSLTHLEAGRLAVSKTHHNEINTDASIAEALDRFQKGRGLTHDQWGLLHFFALKDLTQSSTNPTPNLVQGEIRIGVASLPSEPEPPQNIPRQRVDPGIAGSREDVKRNRRIYDG